MHTEDLGFSDISYNKCSTFFWILSKMHFSLPGKTLVGFSPYKSKLGQIIPRKGCCCVAVVVSALTHLVYLHFLSMLFVLYIAEGSRTITKLELLTVILDPFLSGFVEMLKNVPAPQTITLFKYFCSVTPAFIASFESFCNFDNVLLWRAEYKVGSGADNTNCL